MERDEIKNPLGTTLSAYHEKLKNRELTPEDDAELAEEFAINRADIRQFLRSLGQTP